MTVPDNINKAHILEAISRINDKGIPSNAHSSTYDLMFEGNSYPPRHKPSAVDSENHLLKCYRYIELNPMTANMVKRPEDYQWSSSCCNAWRDLSPVIGPHSDYIKLGRTADERCNSYRGLFSASLSNEDVQFIRKAPHYYQPMGNDRFRLLIEEKIC